MLKLDEAVSTWFLIIDYQNGPKEGSDWRGHLTFQINENRLEEKVKWPRPGHPKSEPKGIQKTPKGGSQKVTQMDPKRGPDGEAT